MLRRTCFITRLKYIRALRKVLGGDEANDEERQTSSAKCKYVTRVQDVA